MSDNGNQPTVQDWRAPFEALAAAEEEARKRAAQEERARKIQERDQHIAEVLDLARSLGIDGEIVEQERGAPHLLRAMPLIARDGYLFAVEARLESMALRPKGLPGYRPGTPPDPETEEVHRIAHVQVDVTRRAIRDSECPLRFCRSGHVCGDSTKSIRINLTTGEGRQAFLLAVGDLLRKVDKLAAQRLAVHAEHVAEQIRSDETAAYFEKEIREYEAEPEPEIDESQLTPTTLPAPPQPRQRVVIEGSFEWRALQLLDELRGGYYYNE